MIFILSYHKILFYFLSLCFSIIFLRQKFTNLSAFFQWTNLLFLINPIFASKQEGGEGFFSFLWKNEHYVSRIKWSKSLRKMSNLFLKVLKMDFFSEKSENTGVSILIVTILSRRRGQAPQKQYFALSI